jgi:hypothetical protein
MYVWSTGDEFIGPEVDYQFDFRGLLNRQVGRAFAPQEPAGVDADLTINIGNAGSIAIRPPAAANSRY